MHDEPNIEDLVLRWREALDRGEVPSAEGVCGDCPEMVTAFERELMAREFARVGIVEVDGAGAGLGMPGGPVAGAEPVPGYRLIRRVGEGRSGEVWEAGGPGGIPLAIKFVGELEEFDARATGRRRRLDNLRSVELMRGVRHPNILPLVGAWGRDGLLILVMELADRTLADRLDEAIREGAGGIPRPELIAYMRQAACGIDFLNRHPQAVDEGRGVGLQHGDIKPQNLFLVGGCVKVADFCQVNRPDGVARDGRGMTTPYAPPELCRGMMSDRSDQYSLAVSYCLLRGGRLPFLGTHLEVMMGHFHGAPDLTMLPEAERTAVARALAKRPADRWPDCRSFVDAIARADIDRGLSRATRPTARRAGLLAIGLLAVAALLATVATSGTPYEADAGREPRAPKEKEAVWRARTGSSALDAADDAVEPAPAEHGPGMAPKGGRGEPGREPEPTSTAGAPPPPPPSRGPEPRPSADRDVVGPPPGPVPPPIGDGKPTVGGAVATPSDSAAVGPRWGGEMVARTAGAKPSNAGPPGGVLGRPSAALRGPMPASITVLMPSARAELVVKGEVGRGNPDEWYGPTRVIHSPPLGRGEDYIVGAFWLDADGRPRARSCRLRVEPGAVYEVDLRPGVPTSKEIPKPRPSGDSSPGRIP